MTIRVVCWNTRRSSTPARNPGRNVLFFRESVAAEHLFGANLARRPLEARLLLKGATGPCENVDRGVGAPGVATRRSQAPNLRPERAVFSLCSQNRTRCWCQFSTMPVVFSTWVVVRFLSSRGLLLLCPSVRLPPRPRIFGVSPLPAMPARPRRPEVESPAGRRGAARGARWRRFSPAPRPSACRHPRKPRERSGKPISTRDGSRYRAAAPVRTTGATTLAWRVSVAATRTA